ncbi:MAG TPA: hypothetical protein DCY13_16750, partial [Verrucomicrobiales bacterium]|nr:hypothetical protein [Verrucomicrobiales bacterium]
MWTSLNAELEVVPAIIRGRLFAADARAEVTSKLGNRDASNYLPREQTGIEIIEYEPYSHLVLTQRVVQVDTDAAGRFSARLPPGRYGIRIAGMTNHWGSHVSQTDLAAGTTRKQGWPFFEEWPWPGSPPGNGLGNQNGAPLLFDSGRTYELDLFVRKQRVVVTGEVYGDSSDPTKTLLLSNQNAGLLTTPYSDLEHGGGQAVLTPTVGDPVMVDLRANDLLNTGNTRYVFNDVAAGDYSVMPTHPRNTFTEFGSANTSIAFSIPAWNPPGVLPPNNPGDFNFVAPLTLKNIGRFDAEFPDPGTSVTLSIRFWDAVEQSYRPPNVQVLEPGDLIRTSYSGDLIFAFVADRWPPGAFTAWFPVGSPGQSFQVDIGNSGATETFDVWVNGPSDNLVPLPVPTFDLVVDAVAKEDPTYRVPNTTLSFTTPQGPLDVIAAGQTIQNFQGQLGSFGVSNPTWTLSFRSRELVDPVVPRIKVVAVMDRGVRVRGSVKRTGDNATLADVHVQVLDRYGKSIGPNFETITDTNGMFEFVQPVSAAPHFLEVIADGYLPWRERFGIGDFIDDGGVYYIDAPIFLEPVPGPQITQLSLDRQGGFLTGVSRSGDESA